MAFGRSAKALSLRPQELTTLKQRGPLILQRTQAALRHGLQMVIPGPYCLFTSAGPIMNVVQRELLELQ